MHDIAHYLRPAHLAQLRRIIDDPEASGNDRFVALDLLKNVNISAGGVLPMCQDTGTAIVMGKKSEGVLTGADDGEAISRGVYDAYTKLNLRYSQLAPLTMYDEKNTGTNLPAQIELYSTPQPGGQPGVQVPVHGQGRRLGQQVLPLPGDQGDPEPAADARPSSTRRSARSAPPPARRTTWPSSSAARRRSTRSRPRSYASAHYLDDLPDRGLDERRTGSATSSSRRRSSS